MAPTRAKVEGLQGLKLETRVDEGESREEARDHDGAEEAEVGPGSLGVLLHELGVVDAEQQAHGDGREDVAVEELGVEHNFTPAHN